MEDDDRELLRRLFGVATELIENAHEVAIAGQSNTLAAPDYATTARRLQAAARDIAVLAEAAMIVANLSVKRAIGQDRSRTGLASGAAPLA